MNFTDSAAREDLITALEELLRSRGWEYMKRELEKSRDMIHEHVSGMSNPNELLKASGQLNSIRLQLSFPAKMLEIALAARKKEQEKNNEAHKLDDPFVADRTRGRR